MRKFEEFMLNHERNKENSQLNDEPLIMDPKLSENADKAEDEFINILELIPVVDLEDPVSIDEFKKKMIQLILELEIESPDGFKTLVEAALEKNSSIDPDIIKEMFIEIEEFIQHFNDGAFDSFENEDGEEI